MVRAVRAVVAAPPWLGLGDSADGEEPHAPKPSAAAVEHEDEEKEGDPYSYE
ncbi:MAG: hypothetical protein PUK59_05690 [Actinomycetaceae bacterium]|nr:hypothetical protein [Actinomycetaceae bacterium]